MGFDLDSTLELTASLGASDLHLRAGAMPRARVDGELVELPGLAKLTPEETAAAADRLLATPEQRAVLAQRGAVDVSHRAGDLRFRASIYRQRGTMAIAFRVVLDAPAPAGLGIPQTVLEWAGARRGLVVVTGATGTGKSTTTACLVKIINDTRRCHIITIEDPIEFVHEDRLALVSQREIGADAPSYADALRSALRQAPDVMVIGEVRDEETASAALRAAETGHLVLATMHTIDAAETVERFCDLFTDASPRLVRKMLAATLVGIASQRLVPARGGGRRLNVEVLVNSARVRHLIATGDLDSKLRDAVAEGDYYGMRTFDQCLLALVREGSVDREEALALASSSHDLALMLAAA